MRRALVGGSVAVLLLACNAILGIRDDVVFDPTAEGGAGPGSGPGPGGGTDGPNGEGGAVGDSGGGGGDGGPGGPPPACRTGLQREVVAEVGSRAELYSIVIAGDLLYAGGYADGTNGGVFRMPKKGPANAEQIVPMPKVFGMVVVGDHLYFTSGEKTADGTLHGGVWSCLIAPTGNCNPKLVFPAYEPGWIEFDGTYFYVADGNEPARFRVDASGNVPTDGGVERDDFGGPQSFVVDHGQVYDLETSQSGVWFPRADFIISAMFDAGKGEARLWDTGNQDAIVYGAEQLAQSPNYVFWGAYDGFATTKSGGIIRRDPKRDKSGTVCAYGGAPRANTAPFALAASADTIYWTNPGDTFGRVECCPIEGPCCVTLGQDAGSVEPVMLVRDDQTPTGLALDGTGIYYVDHDNGAVVRLH